MDSKLFVSVMAGVTIKTLTNGLSNIAFSPRVIRAHPNTPAMVGCGCAVYSLGSSKFIDEIAMNFMSLRIRVCTVNQAK